MKTIVLANAKGGTGKTTVAVNLSACLASHHGKRVLGIDLDSQGNFGISYGIDPRQLTHTAYHFLCAEAPDIRAYVKEITPHLHLIANAISPDLENRLEASHNRDSLLRLRLRQLRGQYDYIVIDTPPAMRTATMNAIVAADEVIVVVDCGYYALYGLTDLMRQIARVSDAYEKDDIVIRGLLNLYNRGQNLDRDVKNEVFDFFGGLMIQTIIHKNVRLAEAASASQPIIEFDSTAPGSFDFLKLSKELLAEYEPETQTRSAKRAK
ncbi:MAG TPA: ParA family protein [Pyrinomonadaceae bacterium]|jgi:chromosome partitioning protein